MKKSFNKKLIISACASLAVLMVVPQTVKAETRAQLQQGDQAARTSFAWSKTKSTSYEVMCEPCNYAYYRSAPNSGFADTAKNHAWACGSNHSYVKLDPADWASTKVVKSVWTRGAYKKKGYLMIPNYGKAMGIGKNGLGTYTGSIGGSLNTYEDKIAPLYSAEIDGTPAYTSTETGLSWYSQTNTATIEVKWKYDTGSYVTGVSEGATGAGIILSSGTGFNAAYVALNSPTFYRQHLATTSTDSVATASGTLIAKVEHSSFISGSNIVDIAVTDRATNAGFKQVIVNVDTTAPVLSVTDQSNSSTTNWVGSSNVVFGVSDAHSGVKQTDVYLDGVLQTSYDSQTANGNINVTQGGQHTVRVVLTDNCDNVTEKSIDVYIDQKAPTAFLTSSNFANLVGTEGVEREKWSNSVDITVTAIDVEVPYSSGLGSVKLSGPGIANPQWVMIGNGSQDTCTYTFKDIPDNGVYTVETRDIALNTTSKTIKISRLDKKKPATPTVKLTFSKFKNNNTDALKDKYKIGDILEDTDIVSGEVTADPEWLDKGNRKNTDGTNSLSGYLTYEVQYDNNGNNVAEDAQGIRFESGTNPNRLYSTSGKVIPSKPEDIVYKFDAQYQHKYRVRTWNKAGTASEWSAWRSINIDYTDPDFKVDFLTMSRHTSGVKNNTANGISTVGNTDKYYIINDNEHFVNKILINLGSSDTEFNGYNSGIRSVTVQRPLGNQVEEPEADGRVIVLAGTSGNYMYEIKANGIYKFTVRDKGDNVHYLEFNTNGKYDTAKPNVPLLDMYHDNTKISTDTWVNGDVTLRTSGGTNCNSGLRGYKLYIQEKPVNSSNFKSSISAYAESIYSSITEYSISPTGVITNNTKGQAHTENIPFVLTKAGKDSYGEFTLKFQSTDHMYKIKASAINNSHDVLAEAKNAGKMIYVEGDKTAESRVGIDLTYPVFDLYSLKANYDSTYRPLTEVLNDWLRQLVINTNANDYGGSSLSYVNVTAPDGGKTDITAAILTSSDVKPEDTYTKHLMKEAIYTVLTNREDGKYIFEVSDVAGNITKVAAIIDFDNLKPRLELKKSPDSTNETVEIVVFAEDEGPAGIASVTLPDGTVTNVERNGLMANGENVVYTVDKDGTYTFKLIDLAGNESEKSIDIGVSRVGDISLDLVLTRQIYSGGTQTSKSERVDIDKDVTSIYIDPSEAIGTIEFIAGNDKTLVKSVKEVDSNTIVTVPEDNKGSKHNYNISMASQKRTATYEVGITSIDRTVAKVFTVVLTSEDTKPTVEIMKKTQLTNTVYSAKGYLTNGVYTEYPNGENGAYIQVSVQNVVLGQTIVGTGTFKGKAYDIKWDTKNGSTSNTVTQVPITGWVYIPASQFGTELNGNSFVIDVVDKNYKADANQHAKDSVMLKSDSEPPTVTHRVDVAEPQVLLYPKDNLRVVKTVYSINGEAEVEYNQGIDIEYNKDYTIVVKVYDSLGNVYEKTINIGAISNANDASGDVKMKVVAEFYNTPKAQYYLINGYHSNVNEVLKPNLEFAGR